MNRIYRTLGKEKTTDIDKVIDDVFKDDTLAYAGKTFTVSSEDQEIIR